ncbi:Glycosyl transferase, group 2 family protein, a member of the cellulose synthase superfamily [hydrothermal vent metagenome]|uniref:Glycosyl transferase, group 2 family protein, a member of the cellulose synthase superfamily n=1 Tax=hydrothermal vent metagenome TaxID=652676 RepID=A0A3B0S3F2_9ZZZZ
MNYRENPPVLKSVQNQQNGTKPWRAEQQGPTGFARTVRVRDADVKRAAFDLAQNEPMRSAASGVSRVQMILIWVISLLFVVSLLLDSALILRVAHIGLRAIFGFAILFKLLILATHFWPKPKQQQQQTCKPEPEPEQWPIYTILLPVYREAYILPKLVEAIEQINYPVERLDIKLLLEFDDAETLSVARQLKLRSNWEILRVPNIGPRTKPKALNVGLARAKGQFVTIYDAEDRPHPDQLRASVMEFAKGGTKLACVQAPLGYFNRKQNWLTRQFSLEYDAQFQVVLPALTRLGLAFPLGGTSNHFRRTALDSSGGWDPYNVTEDADLGFRLAEKGWRSGVISPPTMEEATAGLLPWTGQRSRWIKGFIQTLGVHLRGGLPGGTLRHAVGFFAQLGLSVFSSFAHGLLLLAAVLCVACWPFGGPLPNLFDLALGVGGVLLTWALIITGSSATNTRVNPILIASTIFYWPLQTWAAIRAIIGLLRDPFHWEKTSHGHSLDNQWE